MYKYLNFSFNMILCALFQLHYAVPYSMCKGMVDRFAQIASVGLGAKGIRVNCVK